MRTKAFFGLMLLMASAAFGHAITPEKAIMRAARDPQGIHGTFRLTVRAFGAERERHFLNSELDYHDQRNLTVVIPPEIYEALTARLGGPAEEKLLGKQIEIAGVARRVPIYFSADGRRSDKYYFQTHVVLRSMDDFKLIG